MTRRPEFADNWTAITLSEAIQEAIEYYQENWESYPSLDIATGYFNPGGYLSIADELDKTSEVRILLGAEPLKKDRDEFPDPEEVGQRNYKKEKIEERLQSLDEDIKRDRNLLGFTREMNNELKRLIDFLEKERVKVRRYEDGFLHGKAFIFSDGDGVLAGSSNFTGAGLNTNMELNLGHYQPNVTERVDEWFDKLWQASSEYDLAEIYREQFKPFSPYLIYLRVLWEKYGEEITEEEEAQKGRIQLTTFQNDGLFRARRFLDRYNGVIVADAVGLGKTYIAGKIIEETVAENRQRALVVAPAALRDGMWRSFKAEMNVHFKIVSFAQLRNSQQLLGGKKVFDRDIEEYQLVVVDEAHALRNPGSDQSQSMRRLLRGDPPKDVVLLTATPVNNSLWDLYYLIRYFIQHDGVFANLGIPSLRERFKRAQKQDPSKLDPNMLFDIIDQTTVRRTRSFIEKYYDSEVIETEDEKIHIKFPDPQPRRVDYKFSDVIDDEFFHDVARGLGAAEEGAEDDELTLARYRPSRYRIDEEEKERELSLIGLLRTGLLKRFESSLVAFAGSLENMIEQYEKALELVNQGIFPAPETLDEWVESDSDEPFEKIFSDENVDTVPMDIIDKPLLCNDLQNDIGILRSWKQKADKVNRARDDKLKTLKETLLEIKDKAQSDAINEDEFRQNRKVLIFSYFEDTVDWILEYLEEIVLEEEELACYRGRIAGVAGSGSKKGISQEKAVHGFAPDSTKAPPGTGDNFDILVSTEVLAQGVNLQQCRNVVNYDLPWNPMRVVQRNGRIDRINTPHSRIYSYSFFPEERLDELLELELRIRKKLTQAARSVGLESEVIPEAEKMEKNFADRREDIEALRSEDDDIFKKKDAAAYSGEEFRQELRKGIREREDEIKSLPWGAGSGLRGENPGWFFAARIGEKSFFRFVPLGGEEIVDDTLVCLERIACSRETERYMDEEMQEGVYQAWQTAKRDIYNTWQEQTDPRNLEPDVRPLFRRVAEHLREHQPQSLNQEELEEKIDAVEAPWGRRYERELREVYQAEELEEQEKSLELIEKIDELGLKPYDPPEPLPPIDSEQIKLVCWMTVSPV